MDEIQHGDRNEGWSGVDNTIFTKSLCQTFLRSHLKDESKTEQRSKTARTF